MAKRRGRKPQSIPMKIGNDPALWRFASLQEALEANTHLLARLIQAGAEQAQADGREVEASVLSRMLVLDIAPWKQRDPGGLALKQAEALRQHLPGFTVQFIQWIARQADDKGFARRLADKLVANTDEYEAYLNATLGSLAHTGRMERNWGLLLTVYQLLGDFLAERGAADVLPAWQDAILETVRLVQQERAGDAFIQALDQLLASGEADITASRHPIDPKPGVTIVGYEDEHFVYLLPEIAYREVMRIHPLKFSTAAIGSQLREDGWLIPGSSESHLTMQIRVRGGRVRVWCLKAELFRGDNGDIPSVLRDFVESVTAGTCCCVFEPQNSGKNRVGAQTPFHQRFHYRRQR